MSDRAASSHPHHTAAHGGAGGSALAAVLFAAVLLFGIFVMLRYAYGWAEVASEGAGVVIPMAADGLVAIVSALVTAVGAVWFYATRLAR
jgi:hypothetical protein